MRKSLVPAALVALLLLVPSMALGHSGKGGLSSFATLRSAAVTCAKFTPAREKRMRRFEGLALGTRHAAEHAHARALGRRQACTRTGRLKKSFVATVRAASKRAAKRITATGPPSDVGQWSARMHIDVTGIHATLLPTGKVLYFSYGPAEDGIAALWDPATGTSHRVDPTTHENIWCAGQTQLADGRVLIVGGNILKTGAQFRGLDSIYIFDPWTETWSFQGRMNEGRWYPTTTLLPNGQVVITSGLKRDGSGTVNTDVNVFTPNPDPAGVGTITTVGQKSFNLYPRTYVIRDGRALVAGPQRSDVGLLNPATWTWSSVPQLNGEHYYGTGVLLPDGPNGSSKVMAIGGDQQAGTEVLDAENLGAGWSSRAPLPQSRRNANSVLTPDGAIITIGGNGTDTFIDPRFDALRYDPAANTWTSLAAQAEPRGYHSTAVLLPDARIVSAGDDGPSGGGGQSDEIEVFSPPYLFKGARPSIVSAPDQVSYGAPFAIGTLDTDIAKAVLIAPGATTHANDMHQRLVPLTISPATGGLTATAPATAGIAPPGYYMLFLVNSQGIPSVAKFVKLTTGPPPPPDVTAPTVGLSAPAEGATVTGTTPVSADAADDIGVAGVQFTLDGANLGAEDTAAPYSVSWNTSTAGNGPHALRAIARDAAGNTTTSAPVNVTVANDITPPTVSVSAPAAGATLTGTTPVSADAADNIAVAGVQFTLDGANLGAEDTSSPYSVSWNTATATNGAHALRAIARDAAGNSTTSAPVNVTVSNAAPPVTGLVAAYGFEETSGTAVTDASPANNPGTIAGAAARTANGKIGRAIDFDGVNDYVSVADANSLDLTTGMTLEAWVQLDTVSSWRTTILKEKPGTLSYALYANSSSARPQGEIVTGTGAGTDRVAGVGPALTAGAWTHLALTYDNAQLRLYKNGVQVVQTASTGAIQASALPLRIGGNTIWGEYTDGRIDEVRVYNRALSAAEITTDMTTPVGGGGPPPPDTTPPTVSVSSPAAGASVQGTIPVNATAGDDVGVAGVQFTLDGAPLGAEDTSSPYSVSWNTGTVANGPHDLRAVARDAAGNVTTSAAVTVTVANDITAPTVGVSAPAEGATVSGTTPVNATAGDNIGVAGVQFTLDGANLGAEDTAAPYSVSWNTSTAGNGPHALRAIARDAAGNTTTSAPVNVTVANDITPPTVSVSAPAAGATLTGTTPVSADAADNIAVAGVQFTLDGANLGAEDTAAPYSVSWNTATATNGAHALRAIARDAAGNSTTSAPVTVTVSNAAPPVTGLVAAYGFEETTGTAVTDSSGTGNPGTIGGGAARTAAGKIGRAIDFDGVSGMVSIPDANSLDLTTGMTLEAWVQPDTLNSWREVILKERPGSLTYSLYANTSSNRPQSDISTTAGDKSAGITPKLAAAAWTHLAATYDGANLRLYKNGVLVTTTAAPGALVTSANPLRIGGNTIWGEYFDGRIDEVRVYNRALSAAEITADMTKPVV